MASTSGSSDPDSLYVQDCRQVQSNTHAIQTLTGQISKLVAILHTQQDFAECRRKVNDAVQQATETKNILTRIREHQRQATDPVEKNNRRMMYRKLSDNLAVTARVLEDVVRRYQTEEAQRPFPPGPCGADAAAGQEHAQLVQASLIDSVFEDEVAQPAQTMEQDLSDQRGTALRGVSEDMQCLQKIYTDLATAVEESQTTFESLETHISSANEDIERGRLEIQAIRRPIGAALKEKGLMIGGALLGLFIVGSFMAS